MRAVVQRTGRASVVVDNQTIAAGLTVFLGIGAEDTEHDVIYLAKKIANLRIFSDDGEVVP